MDNFDTAWNALVGYAVQNSHVHTLARESENRVGYDENTDAIIVDYDEHHLLTREQLARVWITLQEEGFLRRENTREALGEYRASVTLALIARALNLSYEERPVTVYPEEKD